SSSMSVRSFGRSRTQTLSSLSTARPVTPPSFHLLGRGFGQSGSNLNFGAVGGVWVWAAKTAQKNTIARPVRLNFITLRFMNCRCGHRPLKKSFLTSIRNSEILEFWNMQLVLKDLPKTAIAV